MEPEDNDDEEGKDEDEAKSEGEEKEQPTHAQIMTRATLMLVAGAAVCAVVSDPMVDAVSSFSKVSLKVMGSCRLTNDLNDSRRISTMSALAMPKQS